LLKGWTAKKTQSIKHPSLLGKGRGVWIIYHDFFKYYFVYIHSYHQLVSLPIYYASLTIHQVFSIIFWTFYQLLPQPFNQNLFSSQKAPIVHKGEKIKVKGFVGNYYILTFLNNGWLLGGVVTSFCLQGFCSKTLCFPWTYTHQCTMKDGHFKWLRSNSMLVSNSLVNHGGYLSYSITY
jgi:hypothetical protein